MGKAQFCCSKPLLLKNLCAIYARIGVRAWPDHLLDLLACWIGQIIDICCILPVLRNYPMPLIGHIIDICLYLTCLEQLFDAIHRSGHWYLLVFLQVLSNSPMPLIGQVIDICLYLTSLEQLSDAIGRWDHWCLLVFRSLEQWSMPLIGSEHWHSLVFCKSWAIIRCHWPVMSFRFACILPVPSNYPMPLIGQIIDICLNFTSTEQLSGAIDRSDHWHLLTFYFLNSSWSPKTRLYWPLSLKLLASGVLTLHFNDPSRWICSDAQL